MTSESNDERLLARAFAAERDRDAAVPDHLAEAILRDAAQAMPRPEPAPGARATPRPRTRWPALWWSGGALASAAALGFVLGFTAPPSAGDLAGLVFDPGVASGTETVFEFDLLADLAGEG